MSAAKSLTDEDLMPMGKDHKGKKLANVPAYYLLYLYDKGWMNGYPELKQYVINNLDVLKKQAGRKNSTYR